jgi:pSer/pThr/pTyr-binding forkhead associated (FHA) protein
MHFEGLKSAAYCCIVFIKLISFLYQDGVLKMEENQSTPSLGDENLESERPAAESAFLIIQGTKAVPLSQEIIRIGRSHDNSVVIDDPRISRHHAEIRLINDHFILFDLGSSGGTYINGQRSSQAMLYPGDVISLAGVEVHFAGEIPHESSRGNTSLFRGLGDRATAIFKGPNFNRWKK